MVERKRNEKAKLGNPQSEELTEARKMTFKDWWPHEKKEGWGPKVEAVRQVGFCGRVLRLTSSPVGESRFSLLPEVHLQRLRCLRILSSGIGRVGQGG